MKRHDIKLPFLRVYKDRHGRVRSDYRRVERKGGPRISVPIKGEAGSPEWVKNYNQIHAGFEGDAIRRSASPDSFADVIPRWLATLRDKAKSTQDNYRHFGNRLVTMIGDQKVADFRVRDVYNLQDAIAEAKTPATADRFITILSLVFRYAKRRDLITTNPAEDIDKPLGYKQEPHRPWTDDEIERVLAEAPPHIVCAVMVLLYTGLRLSDAVRLKWHHVLSDGFIEIRTQKTDTPVSIPIAEELAGELAKPRRGEFLLLSVTGLEYKPGGCSADIKKHMRRIGIDSMPPVHGLRKNAVIKLIEDGNSTDIIHSITGQSKEMIDHYGRDYQRRKLASRAVIKPRLTKSSR